MTGLNNTNKINLDFLISSRMLVQANSGGGKSWLLRRILEQTFGKVQHIIIDIEGEFYTLREKFDYILVSKDGDLVPDFKTAGKLAHKVMELRANVILDLYEMKHQARREYVKLFLDALINAPKKLWHPCLVVVDEAHALCPQKESQVSSTGAVIDLMSRGRKRGLCGILATQRLSKLNKDAAAECINMCIGRTTMDVDVKRAGDILGFHKTDYPRLRGLKPGEFFITGPALSQTIEKVKVGDVKTSHPKVGFMQEVKVVKTTKIKKILKQLEGLPQEADKEKNTLIELRTQNKVLKQELRQSKKVHPEFPKERFEKMVVIETQKKVQEFFKKIEVALNTTVKSFIVESKSDEFCDTLSYISHRNHSLPKDTNNISRTTLTHKKPVETGIYPEFKINKITGGAVRILQALDAYPEDSLTKVQLGVLASLKHSSGTFSNYISLLKQSEYIQVHSSGISITDNGVIFLQENNLIQIQVPDIKAVWRSKLTGGAVRMFDILIERYPDGISRYDLALEAGLTAQSGTFSNYISKLKTNQLMVVVDNICFAEDVLFNS